MVNLDGQEIMVAAVGYHKSNSTNVGYHKTNSTNVGYHKTNSTNVGYYLNTYM